MIHPQPSAPTSSISYLNGLLRRWKLIIGAIFLAALAAGVGTLVLVRINPQYEARADVVVTAAKYQLNFDPKFKTVDTIFNDQQAQAQALLARAEEFKAVATSLEVQRAASEQLQPAAQAQQPAELAAILGPIDIQIEGGLISITAQASDPALAAQRANAYAQAVVTRFNALYGQGPEQDSTLNEALGDAHANYQAAENELVAFTRTNQIDEISQQMDVMKAFRNRLLTLNLAHRREPVDRLSSHYAQLHSLNLIEQDAEALRQQIRLANRSQPSLASASLSLMDIQTRLVLLNTPEHVDENIVSITASDRSNPEGRSLDQQLDNGQEAIPTVSTTQRNASSRATELQLSSDAFIGSDQAALTEDIDALLVSIRERRHELRTRIDEVTQQMVQGEGVPLDPRAQPTQLEQTIEQITQEIHQRQADLREETFRRDLLTNQVATTKGAYETLQAKVQESRVAQGTNSGAATLAASAPIPTQRSAPPPLFQSLVLASLAGLVLGLIAALSLEVWNYGPLDLKPQHIQIRRATAE